MSFKIFICALLTLPLVGHAQYQANQVEWTDLEGMVVDEESGELVISEPSEEWGDIGAASVNILEGSTDGGIKFNASYEFGIRAIGLSYSNEDADYRTINFAFYLYEGEVSIFQDGELICTCGEYNEGDEFSILREDNMIVYRMNEEVLQEEAVESELDMIIDIALKGESASVEDLSFLGPEPPELPEPDPAPQPETPFSFPAQGDHKCTTDGDINWTMNRAYDLNGNVIAAGVDYSDASGAVIQSQTFNISQSKVFANQTLFDDYGRPVIQSLAAPIDNTSSCLKTNFFVNTSGQVYSTSDFEGAQLNSPVAVGNSSYGTLGHYYSNNNTLDAYQATTSYPYSRSYYNPRLNEQVTTSTVPGDAFVMGSGNNQEAYTIPAKGELYYVFGYGYGWTLNSSGNSIAIPGYKVNKTIVRDSEGNESVSFTDKDGKLVASARSGSVGGVNQNTLAVKAIMGRSHYVDIHLPAGCETSLKLTDVVSVADPSGSGTINQTLDYEIVDLTTNTLMTATGGGTTFHGENITNLPAGLYRIKEVTANPYVESFMQSGIITISVEYELNYYDFTLNYYDRAGRLVKVVPPLGYNSGYSPLGGTAAGNSQNSGLYSYNNTLSFSSSSALDHISFTPAASSGSNELHRELVLALSPKTGSYGSYSNADLGPEPPEPLQGGGSSGSGGTNLGNYLGASYNFDITSSSGIAEGSNVSIDLSGISSRTGCDPSATEYYIIQYRLYSNQGYSNNNPDIAMNGELKLRKVFRDDCSFYYVALENRHNFNQAILNGSGDIIFEMGNVYELTGGGQYSLFNPLSGSGLNLLDDYRVSISEVIESGNGEPVHYMASTYEYNSLNQLIAATSPDGGRSEYIYRSDGQVRFSENAKQRANGSFSYTNYDFLGRPVEAGVFTNPQSSFIRIFENYEEVSYGPLSTHTIIENIYSGSNTSADGLDDTYCSDQFFIMYDEPDLNFWSETGLGTYTQTFTRGNISKTYNDQVTTWYSYDDLGRLKWMVQKFPDLGVKTVNYEYNAFGKVKQIVYQKESTLDRFYHKYAYDVQGRLKKVHTSTDNVAWLEQAEYVYDPLGRVKRVELADDLQGMDYTYTLSGGLKSINHPSLDVSKDPGGDRSSGTNNRFAPDVFGLTLDYYHQDYKRSGTNLEDGWNSNNYHNGLIKAARWNLRTATSQTFTDQTMYSYTYDHHRWLKGATYGAYQPSAFTASTTEDYKVWNISYDANGNLKTLNRNAYGSTANRKMDQFTYNYALSSGARTDNRLTHISDPGDNALDLYEDIRDQPAGNYQYNPLGQLTSITDADSYLEYNTQGLVTRVKGGVGSVEYDKVRYYYDDRGFRILKVDYEDDPYYNIEVKRTYYVRDVAGALLAVYERNPGQSISSIKPEFPVYGQGRIGVYDKLNASGGGYEGYFYELADQVGNVRATIAKDFEDIYLPKDPILLYDFESSLDDWAGLYDEYEGIATGVSLVSGTLVGQAIDEADGATVYKTFSIPQNDADCQSLQLCFNLVSFTGSFSVRVQGSSWYTEQAYEEAGTYCINLAGGQSSYTVYFKALGSTQAYVRLDEVRIKGSCPVEYPMAVVLTSTDYYPFGMPMPNRNYAGSYGSYRFAFQGQERDREPGTEHEFFQLRTWDGRIGRWTSTDPYNQYHSAYLGMGNNPISMTDPDGGFAGGGGGWLSSLNDWGGKVFGSSLKPLFATKNIVGLIDLTGTGSFLINNSLSIGLGISEGVKELSYEPVIYVNILNKPKGFNKKEFLNSLRSRLIENGFSENLSVVTEPSLSSQFKHWWNNDPTATVTIRNFRVGQDQIKPIGGWAFSGESHSAVVFNGLSPNGASRRDIVPTWQYVNAAMHELGHAIMGFEHDDAGNTDDPNSIMNYKSAYKAGANFSESEQEKIKKSLWGRQVK